MTTSLASDVPMFLRPFGCPPPATDAQVVAEGTEQGFLAETLGEAS
jgi:hypothetical protein